MKICVSIVFLLLTDLAFAQKPVVNYRSIDQYVMDINAASPLDLAQKLTAPYKTDLEKTRAIFSWIAHNIGYGYKPGKLQSKNGKSPSGGVITNDVDTGSALKPLSELVAEDVLKRRTAFCYGYAHLFKCLCDYSGITCEIINGYARGDFNKIGNNFRTNHTWNAVRLDSNWYLIDATWASGYFAYNSDDFIQRFDDQYFLTNPDQFALDHFPDDLEWSLLKQPPAPGEFQHSPYKSRCFVKYDIISYWPERGVIHAAVGDTINLRVQTALAPGRTIGGGSLNDSSVWPPLSAAVFCKPTTVDKNNTINYTYVVPSTEAQWLQLVYNDDMILRYKLDIKNQELQKN